MLLTVIRCVVTREVDLQDIDGTSQMRSGFVQKCLSQCSRFGALSHVCGPDLLTS